MSNKIKSFIADDETSSVSDYVTLMKPRVMSLVVFSGIVGMIMAPGYIHPLLGFISILCILAGHGAAAALNMWYDRDIDAIMQRTQKRPIVTGKISPDDGLAFGIILSFFSVMILSLCVNFLAGFILLITILFYVFIYTIWLKRSSVHNIVIGGAAGAFPPMIGWAAVTGSISLESIILFLIIFMWTPPHFWSLALYQSKDYKKCNIPMMPIIKGDDYTKNQIILYTILTVLSSLLPLVVNMNHIIYGAAASILGSIFLYYAFALKQDPKNTKAPRMFFFSIIYLFALFIAMIIDHYLVQ